jgi:3-hydroxyisobutyrate dehydrogenase-like beta-hydroxyacid dehydrogenase
MGTTVGFIGLGIMGSRMAANLQKRGYDLVVFNRSPAKAEALLRGGAVWGGTPAETASRADVLITMLSQPDVVAETAFNAGGFLAAMKPGSLWINSTTVNPSFARHMAELSRASRVRYLDAPVTGSRDAAERALLVFLVGGRAADLDACSPLLAAMSRRIVHVGGDGLGSSLKIVNNLLAAVAMASFAEAAALGQALGIPRETIFDTFIGGQMVPPFVGLKRAKMERGDYDTEFSMRWMQKDLHLASLTAYEVDVPMAIMNAAKELYKLAMRDGYADLDMSAIYAFLTGGDSENAGEPLVAAAPGDVAAQK